MSPLLRPSPSEPPVNVPANWLAPDGKLTKAGQMELNKANRTASAAPASSTQAVSKFGALDNYANTEAAAAQGALQGAAVAAAMDSAPATPQGTPAQDLHPSMQRLSTDQWHGMTGQLNRAQAAQDQADVWVTVPVDKVVVQGNGTGHVAPVYAAPQGRQPRPGESAGSIPPTMKAARY